MGWMANKAVYGDINIKTLLTTVGSTVGTLAGAALEQQGSQCCIKDTAAFGGNVGAMVVSAAYKDINATKIYAAQAVGEQVGEHLWGHDEKVKSGGVSLIGKKIGSSCGAAIVAPDKQTQNFFVKKGLIDTAVLIGTGKILHRVIYEAMNHDIKLQKYMRKTFSIDLSQFSESYRETLEDPVGLALMKLSITTQVSDTLLKRVA